MVWYMSCRKWKVNNIVWMWVWRNWALVGVAQWQYWDGGILAETWRKRKNQPYKVWENDVPIRGKAQHKVPEAGKSCECVQNSKKGVMAGAERVNGESEDGGQWGWGGCSGHVMGAAGATGRSLDFTLSAKRSHWKVLSREIMWCDL